MACKLPWHAWPVPHAWSFAHVSHAWPVSYAETVSSNFPGMPYPGAGMPYPGAGMPGEQHKAWPGPSTPPVQRQQSPESTPSPSQPEQQSPTEQQEEERILGPAYLQRKF